MAQNTAPRSDQKAARLVMNHSTHLPGLISLLEKIAQYDGIQTITPGVICPVRAHIPHMKLRISVPIRGGFKIIARGGKIAQEVFILTTLQKTELESMISGLLKA